MNQLGCPPNINQMVDSFVADQKVKVRIVKRLFMSRSITERNVPFNIYTPELLATKDQNNTIFKQFTVDMEISTPTT